MPTEEEVKEALKKVVDPELGINIVDLGLVYSVNIHDDGKVHVRMTLTAIGCPLAATIIEDVKNAVVSLEGVTEVQPELVFSPPWNADMMSEEAKLQLGFW